MQGGGPRHREEGKGSRSTTGYRRAPGKEQAMKKKQRVSEMANEVLARQASRRARRTGEPFEVALEAVRKTEAGRQLEELGEGPHRDERANQWQEDMAQERAEERHEDRHE
jgi:hypothetical protein